MIVQIIPFIPVHYIVVQQTHCGTLDLAGTEKSHVSIHPGNSCVLPKLSQLYHSKIHQPRLSIGKAVPMLN